jgi:NAD(P)-dependent dehydrogenase (short-subunit alcohol dehydrogenase family)
MADAKVALVTGAGSGIGRATVQLFAADGISVLATDRNAQGLAETAASCVQPDRVRTLVQDVAADDAPTQAVGLALQGFGRLDWLVNNAGIGGARAVHETEDADLDRFLAINVRSVFRFAREAVRAMRPGGSIVNLASVFGMIGYPGSSAYAAAKAAVIGLTHQMAADYGPRGIRVNAVAPGLIETAMTRERIASSPRYKALMRDTTPFPRHGQPEDIANAIHFLCSDRAGFINGHVLVVDGGWSVTNHIAGAPEA